MADRFVWLRRQQVAVGPADRKQRGCRLSLPPLKGEVPAKRAEGYANADLGRFNVWRPMVVDRTGGSKVGAGPACSALPTGSKWVQAQPARPCRPAASGYRHCLLGPADPVFREE